MQQNHLHAILWMLLMGILATSISALGRQLTVDFHALQIVFFYNAAAIPFFLPFIHRYKPSHISKRHTHYYNIRAILEWMAFSCVFLAVSRIPFPMLTALQYLTPIFGLVLAVFLLKESSSKYTWIAFVLGIIGVLIITQPSATTGNMGWIFVIISCICFACCAMIIKMMTHVHHPYFVAYRMVWMTTIVSFLPALMVWQPPGLEHLGLIILFGALVFSVQIAVGMAFSKADMTLVLPFSFVNLIWSSLYAYYLFDELITFSTVIGAIVIIYAAYFAVRHAKQSSPTP